MNSCQYRSLVNYNNYLYLFYKNKGHPVNCVLILGNNNKRQPKSKTNRFNSRCLFIVNLRITSTLPEQRLSNFGKTYINKGWIDRESLQYVEHCVKLIETSRAAVIFVLSRLKVSESQGPKDRDKVSPTSTKDEIYVWNEEILEMCLAELEIFS